MSNEEWERTKAFIIQQQAQFAVDIQLLQESQKQTEQNLARTQQVVTQSGEIVERLARATLTGFKEVNAKIDALVDSQIRSEEKLEASRIRTDERIEASQLRLDEKFKELAESQVRSDEKFKESQVRSDEKFKELAESQVRSDEKFKELAESQIRTDEKFKELAESQIRTDEKLRKFIAGLDRYLDKDRNNG